jgi:hypothetical protein
MLLLALASSHHICSMQHFFISFFNVYPSRARCRCLCFTYIYAYALLRGDVEKNVKKILQRKRTRRRRRSMKRAQDRIAGSAKKCSSFWWWSIDTINVHKHFLSFSLECIIERKWMIDLAVMWYDLNILRKNRPTHSKNEKMVKIF